MRFETLTLEAYGAFDARTLDIGDGPGLTIVYGPNEAGKSTLLCGVSDFLFGVPNNSPRGAVFGYDAMKLGATLSTADGRRLTLRRRKGRGKTLTDDTGTPVDDGVLAQLLGSTTRERFQNLFGLDHETLRQGGEQLLSAQGDVGRAIIEAGGGLRTLIARLTAIEAEADKLFSSRRSGERVFYQALDVFTAADRLAKAGLVTRDAHEKLRKAHAAAGERLAALREARRALAARRSGLERAIRVSPLLGEHRRLEAHLATFEDVATLGEDFSDRVTGAVKTSHDTAERLEDARVALEALSDRLAGLQVDARLVAVEGEVLDIAERLANVRSQRADRANRMTELAEADARLAALRRRLHLAPDEDLAPRLPTPAALDLVQRLVADAMTRAPALAAARDRIAELEESRERLRERIADGERLGSDRPFGVNAADLPSLPSRAASLEVRRRQAHAAAAKILRRCGALGFASLEELIALPCPSPGGLQAEINARAALEAERAQCAMELARAEAERLNASAEIDRLQSGGEIPTDGVLGAIRASREEAWAPIRAAHLGETPLPPASEAAAEIASFEATGARADAMSDRRAAEAQRIAALSLAEQQLGIADGRARTSRSADLVASVRLSKMAEAFASALPELTRRHPDVAAIGLFLEDRRKLLDDRMDVTAVEQEVERLAAELEPLVELLAMAERKASLKPPADAGLATRVAAAVAAITAHDEAHRQFQSSLRELGEVEPRLTSETRKAELLDEAERAGALTWGPATLALGAAVGITPRSASELVTQWASADGIIAARTQTQRRLDRMDEDEAELGRRAKEVGEQVGLALPDDEVVAGQMLEARWRENETVRITRAGLEPGLQPLRKTLADREAAVAEATGALGDLARQAGDETLEAAALVSLGARHAARTQTQQELARLAAALATAGDGLALQALREDCAERSIDTLRADLAAATDEDLRLAADHEEAIRAEQALRTSLEGQEDDASVARASVEREAATTRMHAAIERYLELTLARALVTKAIAQVRAEQQDPLIRRAGAFLALETEGEFIGVEADIDEKGQPVVVGVRASGHQVPVATMSDGTRDQLFLAFRLASIERYCAATEPLPFIADDILVHFDDARSRATLELLAGFAQTTQVLLFTHHQAVGRLASALVANDEATFIDLSANRTSLSASTMLQA